jgi:hypothetical protein
LQTPIDSRRRIQEHRLRGIALARAARNARRVAPREIAGSQLANQSREIALREMRIPRHDRQFVKRWSGRGRLSRREYWCAYGPAPAGQLDCIRLVADMPVNICSVATRGTGGGGQFARIYRRPSRSDRGGGTGTKGRAGDQNVEVPHSS